MATWDELNKAVGASKSDDEEQKKKDTLKVASSWDELNAWAATEPKAKVETQTPTPTSPTQPKQEKDGILKSYSKGVQEFVGVSSANLIQGSARVFGGVPELTLKAIEPANVIAARIGQGLYKGLGLLLPDNGKLSKVGDDFYAEMRKGYNNIQDASFQINNFLVSGGRNAKETLLQQSEGYTQYKEENAGEDLKLGDLKDPRFWLYDVYGSTVENAPVMIATYGVGKAAAASQGAAGLWSWLAASGGSTAFSLGINATTEAESAYDTAKSNGKSEAEALIEAERVFNRNFAANSLSETAQMLLLFAPQGDKLKATSPMWKSLLKTAGKITGAGLLETFQERGEDAIQEMADKEKFDWSAFGSKLAEKNISKTDFISFVLGAGMQGVGNVFVDTKQVQEEAYDQANEMARKLWDDGENPPPTGEAAVKFLEEQKNSNPEGVIEAYKETVQNRKTFIETAKTAVSTNQDRSIEPAQTITAEDGTDLGRVEIKQSGEGYVSRFVGNAGEAGAQTDFDYSQVFKSPDEAVQRATDALIIWAEQERTNARYSPETQTRLEELIKRSRQPKKEEAIKVPKKEEPVAKQPEETIPPVKVTFNEELKTYVASERKGDKYVVLGTFSTQAKADEYLKNRLSGNTTQVVTDQAQRQEIQNGITEGEALLQKGTDTNGNKLTPERRASIQKAIDNGKAKLGEKPAKKKVLPSTKKKEAAKQKEIKPSKYKKGDKLVLEGKLHEVTTVLAEGGEVKYGLTDIDERSLPTDMRSFYTNEAYIESGLEATEKGITIKELYKQRNAKLENKTQKEQVKAEEVTIPRIEAAILEALKKKSGNWTIPDPIQTVHGTFFQPPAYNKEAQTNAALARQDREYSKALLDHALEIARKMDKRRGEGKLRMDSGQAVVFEGIDVNNMSQSDFDALNMFLFGETNVRFSYDNMKTFEAVDSSTTKKRTVLPSSKKKEANQKQEKKVKKPESKPQTEPEKPLVQSNEQEVLSADDVVAYVDKIDREVENPDFMDEEYRGILPYTKDKIKQYNSYKLETVDIATILAGDSNVREYVNAGQQRYEGERDFFNLDNPIVIVDGEVVDGFNRILTISSNGGTTVKAYVNEIKIAETKPTPTAQKLTVTAKPEDIDIELAKRAHDGTSFYPEKRALAHQESYVEMVNEFALELEPLVTSDAQQAIAQKAVDTYAGKLLEKYNAYLQAKSRTISPMITGAARFPVERNRKAMESEMKRWDELIEMRDNAVKYAKKSLQTQSIADRGGAAAVAKSELEAAKEQLETMKAANKIIRNAKLNDEQKIAELIKLPLFTEKTARELLKPDFAGRKGFADFSLTSVRNKIKRMESNAKTSEVNAERADRVLLETTGMRIEEHPADERIRIFFEEKPNTDMVQTLKSNGWKYSPLNKTWQRKNTQNGLYNVRKLFGDIQTMEKAVEVEIENVAPVNQDNKLKLVTVALTDIQVTELEPNNQYARQLNNQLKDAGVTDVEVKTMYVKKDGSFTALMTDGKTWEDSRFTEVITVRDQKTGEVVKPEIALKRTREGMKMRFGRKAADNKLEKLTSKGLFKRPDTKVNKKALKDFVEVEGEMIFEVRIAKAEDPNPVVREGTMYLYRKTDTGETRLFPSALGLIEENLEEGQLIEFNIEDIKQAGTYYNVVNQAGDVVAYEGVPSAEQLKKTAGKLPLKNPQTGKLFGSLSPDEWFTVDVNRVIPDSSSMADAIADLRNGQKSYTGLPILVRDNGDGQYEILDGHHRFAQALFADEQTQVVVMLDEAKYKELAKKETDQTEQGNYSSGGLNASVAFDIPMIDENGTPDPRFDLGASPLPATMAHLDEINTVEIPELVDIVREISGKVPEIKKSFRKAGKGGDFSAAYNRIRVRADLFRKNNLHNAAKVLAHELGHMIDAVPDGTLNRGNLIGRLLTLRDFMGSTFNPTTGEKVTLEQRQEIKKNTIKEVQKELGFKTQKETLANAKAKKLIKERYKQTLDMVLEKDGFIQDDVIRKELLAATRFWTPYNPAMVPESYRAYRESAVELYAEALSMLYISPRNLARIAPTFYKQFFANLDAKPTVRDAYFEVQSLLAGDREAVTNRRRAGVQEMFRDYETKAMDLHNKKIAENKERKRQVWKHLKHTIIDKNFQIIDRVKKIEKAGTKLNPDENPIYFLEERNYVGGKIKAIFDKEINPIYQTLTDAEVSWDTFGEALFYERVASGDRSNYANPRGITPDAATELLGEIRNELGVQRWNLLQGQIANFRSVSSRITEMAYEAGLYKEELYAEMKKNPAYAAFQVLDFLEEGMTSRIYKSVGTLRDIANPADSTLLKIITTIKAAERNVVTQKTVEFLKANFPEDIEEAQYTGSKKGRFPLPPKGSKKQLELITVFEKGNLKGYYVDQYIAETINNQSYGQTAPIVPTLRFFNSTLFRPLFIQFNLGFQSFNLLRDFWRFWKTMPNMTILRSIKAYRKAGKVARFRAFGIPKNPTAADLEAIAMYEKAEEAGILSLTFNDIISGRTPEDKQIEKILADTGIKDFQPEPKYENVPRFAKPAVDVLNKAGVLKAANNILGFIESLGNYIETLPKAAAVYELKGTEAEFLSREQASFIRRKVGSPDFLAGGTWKPATNEIFLFSNAIIQGIRSDIEVAVDPSTRSGYWWKTAKFNFLPKIIMYGALMGLFGDDAEEILNSASEYDRTNYTIIPLGKDEFGKAVYFRLPSDETGRFLGATFWKALTSPTNKQPIGSDIMQIVSYTGGQIPSVTPVVESISATAQYMSGKNPYDSFRGRNVLSDTLFQAGGMEAHKAFLGWQFQQLGGGIFYKFYHEGTPPEERSIAEKIFNLPVLGNVVGRFVRVSDYGQLEALREIENAVKTEEAKASIEKRQLVNTYTKQAQEDGQLTENLANQMVLEYFNGEPKPSQYQEADRLKDRLRLQVIRGSAEPEVVAVIDANTNNQKAAILLEIAKTSTQEDFDKLISELQQAGVITEGTLEKLQERSQR